MAQGFHVPYRIAGRARIIGRNALESLRLVWAQLCIQPLRLNLALPLGIPWKNELGHRCPFPVRCAPQKSADDWHFS